MSKELNHATKDEGFLHLLEKIQSLVSKILSVAMVLVILFAIGHLGFFLVQTLLQPTDEPFTKIIFQIFSLFLNILIALELLENITAYLQKNVIQVELVIVTSLIAVSRKIIILDLEKTSGIDLIGLAIAILALSISYFTIKYVNKKM
ncbi:MAG: phosphate-starvation-inducible PsiE family protein [Aphanothece sp. CMT-3BRIN-NPC111]|nr:phosphate-starvation-inducible PsiE family protein [Aphanothece sp. CMT-3BRIN-NPC111]